jgi:hypothetical protein
MFTVEPLKSIISKTIAADSCWRIVTADPTLVRAILTELEEVLPSIGNSIGISDSAWLTLHFWIDNRPKPRLGIFWRSTSVRDHETRNRVLKALLESGGTGFAYRGAKNAWSGKDDPTFSGKTVSNEWWPAREEPGLLAAADDIRNQLRDWNKRLPNILHALTNTAGTISSNSRIHLAPHQADPRPLTTYDPRNPSVVSKRPQAPTQLKKSKIKLTPPLPDWVRDDLFQPHYTNIHALLTHQRLTPEQRAENTRRLYGTETMDGFNDWNAPVLLLAKDAGPMQTFLRLIEQGDRQPWRHADHRDSKGTPTNERLRGLASIIPGTKLYGSVMAGLLRNDGRQRGALPNFNDPKLQAYLHRILTDVIFPNMKNLRVIICLGNDACQVVGTVLDQPRLAYEFDALRRNAEPIEYDGKHVFAAWHPVASESSENVRRVWMAAARTVSQQNKK